MDFWLFSCIFAYRVGDITDVGPRVVMVHLDDD